MPAKNVKRNFFLRIVLPALLVFILFTFSFFSLIIPAFQNNLMNGKREMISELTNSAWSILDDLNSKVESNLLALDDAQQEAIEIIKNLRYGLDNKDYFWITDEHPNMIMHPYRPELNGTDLSDYSDPEGKKLFVEFVKVVGSTGEGFVDYMWQWKDDSTKIVPKLSYVKEFKSWNWIIGTGIYIEDVKDEIDNLIRNLFYVSGGIMILVGFILFYIGRQSFKIENERIAAEDGLKESEKKYRALVEASTDGLIMILDGKFVYCNNAMSKMMGSGGDIRAEELYETICSTGSESLTGVEYLNNVLHSGEFKNQFEAQLQTLNNEIIDVIFFTSKIGFGDKSGYTIIVKDIRAHKKITEELGENRTKFNSLIKNINLGVFRSTLGRQSRFTEVNSAALKVLGFSSNEELFELKFEEFFRDTDERKLFFEILRTKGEIKNNIIQLRRKDGTTSIVSISAVMFKDDEGNDKYIDGIIEDISERLKVDEERESLITELQTSLKFLHQPVENFVRHLVVCNMNDSISQAAKRITKHKYSAVLVQTDAEECIGIVTDHDLRKRVIAENYDISQPVYNIMSAPLMTISNEAMVFEAFMSMHENSTRHLAVKNNEGKIIGLISSEELLKVERQSSAYLLREIDIAESVEELSDIKEKLPRLVKTLVDSGAKAKNIFHIITPIFDSIVKKLIELAVAELGDPPADFSFVALGSAGRKEQTLFSDQDNAIILDDVPDSELSEAKRYFDKLARIVCDGLNECGYPYCNGEAMACNPKWTQPVGRWIDYFHNWIANSTQQDLIDISIYFDFRHVYGSTELADKLRGKIADLTNGQSGFFQHLTKNCILHKPPVGMLGKLILESKGDHAETFDIKMASMPISDYARIYALKYNLYATNTLERLDLLFEKGIINKVSHDEIVLAYNFLMQVRLKHQTVQINEKTGINNFINPKELTQIEINTLKNTFSQILALQKKLNYDFSGEAI